MPKEGPSIKRCTTCGRYILATAMAYHKKTCGVEKESGVDKNG